MTTRRSFLRTCLSALGAAAVAPLAKLSAAVPTGKWLHHRQVGVNVMDFGAQCDGVTDDTAAIQAAIDFVGRLSGGVVYFPPGVCRVYNPTKPLVIHDRRLVIDGCLDVRNGRVAFIGSCHVEPGPVRLANSDRGQPFGFYGYSPAKDYVNCLIRV